jgi:anti-sigma factor RsiW
MSHLGDLLSALVDGEVSGADRDRVSAHLARCAECRGEAAALRELKRELRSLATQPLDQADADTAMTQRLLAISAQAGAAGPTVPAQQRKHRIGAARIDGGSRGPDGRRGPDAQRAPGGPGRTTMPRMSKRNRRFLVVGAMSIMVTLGTAAFSVGGSTDTAPGPRITPQYELYSEEHAIDTGEVPLTGPPAGPSMAPELEPAGLAQEP